MDGFGLTSQTEGNAIYAEGTPNIKKLMEKYPATQLGASGMSVVNIDNGFGAGYQAHMINHVKAGK